MAAYWKNIASVLTGSAVAQMIPLLASLIIARLFSPAEFGVFSVWLGLVMLLAVFLTCRYDMALPIQEDGLPRQIGVIATTLMVLLLSFLITMISIVIFTLYPRLLTYPIELVVMLLPAASLLSIVTLWQSWAAADGKYGILSSMRIAQAALVTIAQVVAGLISADAVSLAFAQIIGTLIALVFSVYLLPLKNFLETYSQNEIFNFWVRQRKFPFFSLPADFINTASSQLPILIIASRFGADIAGMVALSMKVLGAPIGLLGKAVLDVFKRYAASSYKERGECREEYVKTFKVLALGSMLFCIPMIFVSEPLFVLAFGHEWVRAGEISVWLLPLFAFRFIASPLSYMVYIAEKQHLDLFWQIGLLGVTLFCLGFFSEYKTALQSYSLGYSLLYLIYLGMSYQFSRGVKH